MALRFPDDPLLAHRFGERAPVRLGVEEELFLVDPRSHAIRFCADEVLARHAHRRLGGDILGEMADGVVALATPVVDTADDAVTTLARLRRAVVRDGDVALLGAGLYPTAPFGDVRQRAGATTTRSPRTPAGCCASRRTAACTSTSGCPTPRRRSPPSTGCASGSRCSRRSGPTPRSGTAR